MNRFKTSLYICAGIICVMLITFALHIFPRPGTDSVVFIPTAYLYSKGFGLANPLYYVTRITDATHTNRFNYYVPLYSFLLGLLSKVRPGYKTIFFICSLVSTLNIFLYVRLILSIMAARQGTFLKAAVLLSVAYIAIYLLPTTGRPENFTYLFVFLVYILYRNRNKINNTAKFLLLAILFASMLATQLICFYFCFLFYVLYDILNTKNMFKTVLLNIGLFILIIALFCIILQLSPNGLINTLNGIYIHIHYVIGRSDRSVPLFIHYWLLAPTNVGFLVIFLLALGFFASEIYGRLQEGSIVKGLLSLLLLMAIAAGVVKFILYASPTIYNATEFILPLLIYVIQKIAALNEDRYKKSAAALLAATCLSGTLLLCWDVALFTDYMNSGKDYDSAKSEVVRLTRNNRKICMTGGMWSLFDKMDNITLANTDFKPGDTLVVQETYAPFPKSVTDKYQVIYDWRSDKPAKFMGVTIAKVAHNYGFVVYKIR